MLQMSNKKCVNILNISRHLKQDLGSNTSTYETVRGTTKFAYHYQEEIRVHLICVNIPATSRETWATNTIHTFYISIYASWETLDIAQFVHINMCHGRFGALHNFCIYQDICGSQVLKNIKILGNTLFIYQKIWSIQCLHIKRDLRYTTSTYIASTQYISRARDLIWGT